MKWLLRLCSETRLWRFDPIVYVDAGVFVLVVAVDSVLVVIIERMRW